MDGYEFLGNLRRMPGGDQPKVVFCTTENDVAHIARALHAGANEYIMKPFDKDIVTAKFQEVGLLQAAVRLVLSEVCLRRSSCGAANLVTDFRCSYPACVPFREAARDPARLRYLRKFLKDNSGLDLSADKQYLIESRLLPLARKAGLPGISELVQK